MPQLSPSAFAGVGVEAAAPPVLHALTPGGVVGCTPELSAPPSALTLSINTRRLEAA